MALNRRHETWRPFWQRGRKDYQSFLLDLYRSNCCASILVGVQGYGARERTGPRWDPRILWDSAGERPDIGHTWSHISSCGSRRESCWATSSWSKHRTLWVCRTHHNDQRHYHRTSAASGGSAACGAAASESRHPEQGVHLAWLLQRHRGWNMPRLWEPVPCHPPRLLARQNLPARGSVHPTFPQGLHSHRTQQPDRRWWCQWTRGKSFGHEDWPFSCQLPNTGGHPPVQANYHHGASQRALENQVKRK